MKTQYWKSPSFKKWGLFFGLVLTLGFSLSWNPNYLGYAEYRNYKYDLASTAISESEVEAARLDALAKEAPKFTKEQDEQISETLRRMLDEQDKAYAFSSDIVESKVVETKIETPKEAKKEEAQVASKVAETVKPKEVKEELKKPGAPTLTVTSVELSAARSDMKSYVADNLKIDTEKSDSKDTYVFYQIKKKTEAGAAETCTECGALQKVKIPSIFVSSDSKDLSVLANLIIEQNKGKLFHATDKDKMEKRVSKKGNKEDKEDKKYTSGLHENCKKLSGRAEKLECQKNEILVAEEACEEEVDSTSCRTKIRNMFKPIKSFLASCTRNIGSERCEDADDFAAEILEATSSRLVQTEILRIGRQKVNNIARDYQMAFKTDNAHPSVAASWLSGNGGVIDRISIPLGNQFYEAIANNENIQDSPTAMRMYFNREFLDPIKTLKRGLYENPLDYNITMLNLDDPMGRTPPANLAAVRGGKSVAPAPATSTSRNANPTIRTIRSK